MTPLTRIASTALYKPSGPETFVFLEWAPSNDPTVSMESTWADSGPSPVVGYYVFLPAIPPASDAPAVEEGLRSALPVPAATGLAWARFSSASLLEVVGKLPVVLADQRPVVGRDASAAFPKGMPTFAFPDGLPLASLGPVPAVNGLVVTSCHPSSRVALRGVVVALLGPASGCIAFQALPQSIVLGDRTTKSLAAAQLDPLRPYDHTRTWVVPLAAAYVFSVSQDDVYRLDPLTPGSMV